MTRGFDALRIRLEERRDKYRQLGEQARRLRDNVGARLHLARSGAMGEALLLLGDMESLFTKDATGEIE